MKRFSKAHSLLAGALIVPLLLLGGCSSDSSGPGGDTTAPTVLSISPSSGDTGVGLSQDVTIVFSEDMKADSATGNVTLSAGTISDLTWSDAHTLVVGHDAWPEGTQITVTVGTGLKDQAGNALAAQRTSSFYTMATGVHFLASEPADGAIDVLRNTAVRMLFSTQMNLSNLQSTIMVDATVAKQAPVSFTLSQGDGNWVDMHFHADLPANATVTVDITGDAQSSGGTPIAEAASFSFTTGATADNTPPTLVSVTPANGSVVPASTSQVVFTFSEAINTDNFNPTRYGLLLELLIQSSGVEPQWSDGDKVLTVFLAAPLPAGVPLSVHFDTYEDTAGNIQTTPLDYSITVAGTADYYPFIDGATYFFFVNGVENPGTDSTSTYTNTRYIRMDQQSAGVFRRADYMSGDFLQTDNWDNLQRFSNRIELTGFHDTEQGSGYDVTLSPAALWAKIPWQMQSWNGSATATTPGGTITINYSMQVVGKEDVDLGPGVNKRAGHAVAWGAAPPFAQLYWEGCWKQELSYTMLDGDVMTSQGTQTFWFCPAVGIVREHDDETEASGRRSVSDSYLQDLVIPGLFEPQG